MLIIANTTRRLDPALLEAAQTLGAKRRQLLWRVVVPGIITDLYSDSACCSGWAWTYLIVAELIGVSSGITFFINQQAKYRAYDRVFASIILIGLIGLTTDVILASLGRQLFPWAKHGARRLVLAGGADVQAPRAAHAAAAVSTEVTGEQPARSAPVKWHHDGERMTRRRRCPTTARRPPRWRSASASSKSGR